MSVKVKNLLEQYKENEENNLHTENLLLLAKAYGTPMEVSGIHRELRIIETEGHLDARQSDSELRRKVNGYYKLLIRTTTPACSECGILGQIDPNMSLCADPVYCSEECKVRAEQCNES